MMLEFRTVMTLGLADGDEEPTQQISPAAP